MQKQCQNPLPTNIFVCQRQWSENVHIFQFQHNLLIKHDNFLPLCNANEFCHDKMYFSLFTVHDTTEFPFVFVVCVCASQLTQWSF